jgi:hypothetical protein
MNRKLLIVTDLGLLKAYQFRTTRSGSPRLELLEERVLEQAHHRLVDGVTDLAGRRAPPTRKGGGVPLADNHNLRLETRRRLTRQIANHCKRLIQEHDAEGVWLAALKELNHQIVAALPKTFSERIEVNLARDLVKAGRRDLIELFAPSGRSL